MTFVTSGYTGYLFKPVTWRHQYWEFFTCCECWRVTWCGCRLDDIRTAFGNFQCRTRVGRFRFCNGWFGFFTCFAETLLRHWRNCKDIDCSFSCRRWTEWTENEGCRFLCLWTYVRHFETHRWTELRLDGVFKTFTDLTDVNYELTLGRHWHLRVGGTESKRRTDETTFCFFNRLRTTDSKVYFRHASHTFRTRQLCHKPWDFRLLCEEFYFWLTTRYFSDNCQFRTFFHNCLVHGTD